MVPPFVKYRDVFEASELAEFTLLLNSHDIEFETEDFDDTLGSIYGSSPVAKGTTIKVREVDFPTVDALLNAEAANLLDTVDRNYHLFNFSDEELLEIIAKPDEWSAFDYQVAKSILASRGTQLGEETLSELKRDRLNVLSLPEPPQAWFIWWGYLLAICGGFLGLFIGWHLWTSKKVLPNGQSIYNYTRSDRRHGKRIFVVGLIMTISLLIYRLTLTGSARLY